MDAELGLRVYLTSFQHSSTTSRISLYPPSDLINCETMADDLASWALVLFTGVLAGATIWYALEMRRNTRLQKQMLDFQEKVLEEEKKPVLFISPSIGTDVFYIWLVNIGKSSAKDVTIDAWFKDEASAKRTWRIPSLLPGRSYQFNEAFKIPDDRGQSDEFIIEMNYRNFENTACPLQRITYGTRQWLEMKGKVKHQAESAIVTDVLRG